MAYHMRWYIVHGNRLQSVSEGMIFRICKCENQLLFFYLIDSINNLQIKLSKSSVKNIFREEKISQVVVENLIY